MCVRLSAGCGWGLSPRVRGNHRVWPHKPRGLGSIPACAGEPRTGSSATGWIGVYPRVCGGTTAPKPVAAPTSGLSPRVRGNRGHKEAVQKMVGSIPACAGEPQTRRRPAHCGEVYPRVCGGTRGAMLILSVPDGLSPRVRGNLSPGNRPDGGGRSIPACAGEPGQAIPAQGNRRVYPRVCGGTHTHDKQIGAINGLSPRVRGNPSGGKASGGAQRSIPACAGEPP